MAIHPSMRGKTFPYSRADDTLARMCIRDETCSLIQSVYLDDHSIVDTNGY